MASIPSLFEDNSNDSEFSALAIPSSNTYTLRYTTFIPQLSVSDPFSLGNYLKGDNRGYSITSAAYRTRSDVALSFANSSMTLSKYVNPSHRCSTAACTSIIKTATASTSGMTIHKDVVSSSKMNWRINHDIGIPFGAIYPNINYFYEAALTKTSLNVKGSHDKAPGHELYLITPAAATVTVHRTTVTADWQFSLLIPGAPQTFFNVSY